MKRRGTTIKRQAVPQYVQDYRSHTGVRLGGSPTAECRLVLNQLTADRKTIDHLPFPPDSLTAYAYSDREPTVCTSFSRAEFLDSGLIEVMVKRPTIVPTEMGAAETDRLNRTTIANQNPYT